MIYVYGTKGEAYCVVDGAIYYCRLFGPVRSTGVTLNYRLARRPNLEKDWQLVTEEMMCKVPPEVREEARKED